MLALSWSWHTIPVVVLFINVLYFIENRFTSVSALAFGPGKPRQAVPRLRSQPQQLSERTATAHFSVYCAKEEKKAPSDSCADICLCRSKAQREKRTNGYAHTFSSTKFSANGPLKQYRNRITAIKPWAVGETEPLEIKVMREGAAQTNRRRERETKQSDTVVPQKPEF